DACCLLLWSGFPPCLHSCPPRRSSDLLHKRTCVSSLFRPARPARGGRQSVEPHSRNPLKNNRKALSAHPHSRREPLVSATAPPPDRKSTRLNSSHVKISYAVFCLKKKR